MKMINTTRLLTGMLVISALQATRGENAAMKEMAATCPTCEMTWVAEPGQIGKIVGYQKENAMECEGCKSAVAEYFKTGKFEHPCKTCSNLTACIVQPVNAYQFPPFPGERALSVMGSKSQEVWVKKPGYMGKFTAYSVEKAGLCSSCQNMAVNMINMGKTSEKCPKCGNELTACTAVNDLTEVASAP